MYQRPDDILEYFHLFLDDQFSLWYLTLDSKFKNFVSLEQKFLSEVFRLEQEEEDNLHLKEKPFIEKLKIKYSKDALKLEEISSQPLTSFFKYKCLMLRRMYKSLSDSDMIRMVIFLFEDEDIKLKLSKYLKVSLKDVFETIKLIDQLNLDKD